MPEWTLSVSELNEYVRKKLAGDPMLRSVHVKGEISGFKRHISGHMYFTLKDENARVSCAMFRTQATTLSFQPQDGHKVRLIASAGLYAASGTYQLYVESMEKDGTGNLFEQFERLKRRLADEGLFDPAVKKPLPVMPKTIGVVTSSVGAAFRDIVRVSKMRDPSVTIIIAPCAVQGAGAAEEIARAIQMLNKDKRSEVILVGRGGGSMEDLWAFNEEIVARAIFASKIPIISCVGHEIDFTISDFVADTRAATPSNAAEIAVADVASLKKTLFQLGSRLKGALKSDITKKRMRLSAIAKSSCLSHPTRMLIDDKRRTLKWYKELIDRTLYAITDRKRKDLNGLMDILNAVNPENVLKRGYSVVYKDGNLLKSAQGLQNGEKITIRMQDALIHADVKSVTGKETNT
ncbi:MAG: exodeoxyribonuclease VII large subunit [Clostridia bacterium]|nr:exodeoxyribonuclease VII large subunit [Clostridia bacterium]